MPYNLKDDEVIALAIKSMESQNDRINPIALVCDTYDALRKANYNQEESLRLTDIICKTYTKNMELNILEQKSY